MPPSTNPGVQSGVYPNGMSTYALLGLGALTIVGIFAVIKLVVNTVAKVALAAAVTLGGGSGMSMLAHNTTPPPPPPKQAPAPAPVHTPGGKGGNDTVGDLLRRLDKELKKHTEGH